ncbi:hypothetical protein ACHAXR_012679 [Thalassiosira sp. AJA248-18]
MASTTSNNKDNQQHLLLLQKLQNFTTRHTSHHVPVALVTSGGTAADLEHNCVRFLDNFSTGTRGAYAVEEFCKRGYAVIHLKREGSVAPFGRVLGSVLKGKKGSGSSKGGGLDFDSLGILFDCDDEEEEDYADFGLQDVDEDDELVVEEKTKSSDPWMYSSNVEGNNPTIRSSNSRAKKHRDGELSLNPRLVHSPLFQSTIRAYKRIKQQGLLLTINFRTVDDYLHKLQMCSEAVNMCGSLAVVYLAAAVSDFYIPDEEKVLHKIQSRDYGIKSQASSMASSFGSSNNNHGESSSSSAEDDEENKMQIQSDNTLTLTLYPVPKVIPSLRKKWCPNAYVISFKLETDPMILRQKAVMAMQRNDVHLVIGNELATRYEKVFIVSHKNGDFVDDSLNEALHDASDDDDEVVEDLPKGYQIAEVTASHGLAMSGCGSSSSPSSSFSTATTTNVDALEHATIEYVVRRHFHYISTNINGGTVVPNLSNNSTSSSSSAADMAASHVLQAASLHEERLNSTFRQLQREKLKARVSELAWNMAGSALGMAISPHGIDK